MKTSSIAVETSRSTTLSDSIVRQMNKRSSYLSYTTMNSKRNFNDSKTLGQKISTKTGKQSCKWENTTLCLQYHLALPSLKYILMGKWHNMKASGKNTGPCFALIWRPHAKIQAFLDKNNLVQNQPHLKLRNSLRSLPSYTCNTKKKVWAKLHVWRPF